MVCGYPLDVNGRHDIISEKTAIFYALLSALFYAVNIPYSKTVLEFMSPTMLVAFLYFGAAIGMYLYERAEKVAGITTQRDPLTKKEYPALIWIVILDILAAIFIMTAITETTASNVSLVSCFQVVTTALFALFLFKECISRSLWLAIIFVTIASIALGYEGEGTFSFNLGSLMVIAACICWGLENNLSKTISHKSSVQIVVWKGLMIGAASLFLAMIVGEGLPAWEWIFWGLMLGFITYGLSINFYMLAMRGIGAAKTNVIYSISPFLGVIFSIIIHQEEPTIQLYIGFLIMIIATYYMIKDTRFPSTKTTANE